MSIKKFGILLLLMDISICIYSIPLGWVDIKRHIWVLPGLFIYFSVLGLWLPAIMMLLFGFVFYYNDRNWIKRLSKTDVWTLKILYIIIGSLIMQLVFYGSKEFLEDLIKVPPIFFLSGLTVLLFYEYLMPDS